MFIKEYCPRGDGRVRFVLRANHYGRTLNLFDNLYEEAKKNFPLLNRADVEVVQYGGISYKHTFGIEFWAGDFIIPEGYERIAELEYRL